MSVKNILGSMLDESAPLGVAINSLLFFWSLCAQLHAEQQQQESTILLCGICRSKPEKFYIYYMQAIVDAFAAIKKYIYGIVWFDAKDAGCI